METEQRTPEALQQLSHIWWLAVGLGGAIALGATTVAARTGDHVLAGALVVAFAGVLGAGVAQLRRPAPWLTLLAVAVFFVATERLQKRPGDAVVLMLVAAAASFASGQLALRQTQLAAALSDLYGRAERRRIRDNVGAALEGRRSDNYIEREFVRAQRYGREVTIAVAEVDNLELLRRESGSDAAQAVLARLGELFSQDSRLPDGGVSDDLRLVFVLPETPLLGGRVVAERVRLNFQALQLPGADDLPLTVSIGVASFPKDGERAPAVLAAAEGALDFAIGRGGNRTLLSRSPAGTPDGWSRD